MPLYQTTNLLILRKIKNTFYPPSKIISFNAKLKNNDGLLIKYISETEGITDLAANKKIEKERENILYQLDNGENVEITGVGTLYMDDKKQLFFDSLPEENLLMDSFGLAATNLNGDEEAPAEKITITEKPKPEKKTRLVLALAIGHPSFDHPCFYLFELQVPPIKSFA